MGGEAAPTGKTKPTSAKAAATAPVPAPAAATPETPAPTEADIDARVREHYVTGARALDDGRHEEAYRFLLQAWSMKKHSLIAANLGVAELQLGRHRDAAEHLAYFLREATGVAADEIRNADWMLQQARKHIVTLTLEVSEPGAVILVDGRPVGTAPLRRELFVDAGQRVIEARRAGYAPAQAVVDLVAGSTQPLRLELRSLAAASKGGADAPAPQGEPVVWPALVAAGVAIGGIGAGIGFTVAANDVAPPAPADQAACGGGASSACARVAALQEEKDRFSTLAVVGYTAGGLAAAGAAALVIWPLRREAPGPGTTLTPTASIHGGGLSMKGTF